METPRRPALTLVPAGGPVPAAPASGQPVRLPEGVYRRRRLLVALIAAAALTLVLVVARADRVPPGEANPWPSTGEASLPAEFPGVYVVQAGDTLWDIALALSPGEDPRALVHDLAEAAGGAGLEPGQQIVIEAVPALLAGGDSEPESRQPAAGADR